MWPDTTATSADELSALPFAPTAAAIGAPHPDHTRSLATPAPDPVIEIETEQRLLELIERSLRSEARRYGVDLDGWGLS
jgi:hypothetical protein